MAPDDGAESYTKRPLDVDFQKMKKKTRKIKFSCRSRAIGTKIWGKAASENEHRDAERKVPQWCELFSQYSSGTCSWTRTRRYGAPRIKNTANAKETNLVNVLYTMKRLLWFFFCMRRMESCAQRFTIFLSSTTKKHEFLFSENFTFLRPRIKEKSHLSPLNGQRAARKSGRDAPFAHLSNARFSLIILQFYPSPYTLLFTISLNFDNNSGTTGWEKGQQVSRTLAKIWGKAFVFGAGCHVFFGKPLVRKTRFSQRNGDNCDENAVQNELHP